MFYSTEKLDALFSLYKRTGKNDPQCFAKNEFEDKWTKKHNMFLF